MGEISYIVKKGILLTICIVVSGLVVLLAIEITKLTGENHQKHEVVGETLEENGLSLTEKDITIPGIKGEYQFLFLSDFHGQVKTTDYIDIWNISVDDRIAMFSNGAGVSSFDQFSSWMQVANEMETDAVLLGGDTIDYLTKENTDRVYEELETLSMPYLYTMGNHDSYDILGSGKYQDRDKGLARVFQEGDYECQVLDFDEFYIVSVNDKDSNARAKVSEQALEEFKKIYEDGKPMILMVHVPFTTERTEQLALETKTKRGTDRLLGLGLDSELEETSREFYDMVLDEDSPVVAVLAGHIHFYHEDYLNNTIFQIVSDTSSNGSGLLIHVKGK